MKKSSLKLFRSPRVFRGEIESSAACTSLAFCPFEEPYLLVAGQDGSIRLHQTGNERPLITWAGTVDNEPILQVQHTMHK